MSRRLLLIVNPRAAAGQARGRREALLAAMNARGLQADHALTEHPGHATALACEAAGAYDALVAVGGDGTVHEVASGILLSGHHPALGVIPFGTGNDVARLLGCADVEAGLRALAGGATRAMDVIEVRCVRDGAPVTRYALLYAGVGFVGALLRYTTPLVKRLFGMKYSYSVGFFRALLQYDSPVMRIAAGGEATEARTFFACAGNAEYAGGGAMRLSPGARVDDGLLNISLIPALSRPAIARHFPRLIAGTHVDLPAVRYFTAADLAIDTDRPLDVAVDGDLVGHTPVACRVRARALRVLCRRAEEADAEQPEVALTTQPA